MEKKQKGCKIQETGNSIRFTFCSNLAQIDSVCERTTRYLRSKIKNVEDQLFSINLVIREGLTNAVRHGNAGDPEKKVSFLLTITGNGSVKLAIEDQGEGFDWKKMQNLDLSCNEDHGRGIKIMDTYFTHCSYNEKGNILYLEKKIPS